MRKLKEHYGIHMTHAIFTCGSEGYMGFVHGEGKRKGGKEGEDGWR